MHFDLNFPVTASGSTSQPKKNKGKQPQQSSSTAFTPAQIKGIEARLDLLEHLGYTVIAFNQSVNKKIDPKTHVNILDELLKQLRARPGTVFLKRLTIVLDNDSEKGFGLTNANTSLVEPYDVIALLPTTSATFSLACLTHSLPSPLTAHIIALPLTLPRLPFQLKHTLVRTAIKNGTVFEINYAGAIGGESDASLSTFGVSDTGVSGKRNWWAAAREVVRVTKGKGIIVSGGVASEADYRGPKDIANLLTLLDLAQNLAHDASVAVPKSLILRAQARKIYRAVLSEPRLVVPEAAQVVPPTQQTRDGENIRDNVNVSQTSSRSPPNPTLTLPQLGGSKKRTCDEVGLESTVNGHVNKKIREIANVEGKSRKKKKGGNRERAGAV
ncbi:RNase P subunit p30-domain-containing protein [Suillus subaureus]|uniref:RNase P subunit p30-domain-containing protein n=1 Tax=Suillus subaureus TaxID=48587 RepID=A0A9P7EPK6_9AGAM|nr:RNase P subunit p30-domain-containing protein [Suillus subaureus]KAG1826895.1 RNase P subunit p30-domain-containing protein [Suillus subaureus]